MKFAFKRSLLAGVVGAAFAAMVVGQVHGAVTAEEAAQLGGPKLTEYGAERAGNKDGTIPAYDRAKAITKPLPGYKPTDPAGGYPYPDPFPDEKPLFSITAENMAKYADKLTDGVKYILSKKPGFRMDIYPTHRTIAYPTWVGENTKKCATTARTVAGGVGIDGAHACFPFPIPKTGQEAMWNANIPILNPYEYMTWSGYLIDSSGELTLFSKNDMLTEHEFWDNNLKKSEYLNRLITTWLEPAGKNGNMSIRNTPLRMDIKEPVAYAYTMGQRRSRMAPEFTYDTVVAAYGGVMFYDEALGFDGKMDRFDFKLLGKREIFIPYNVSKLGNSPIEKVAGKHFLNPDVVRWELHRVWVVDATLKPGLRHANSRKVFYIDEDALKFSAYDGFDQAGKLMRTQIFGIEADQAMPGARGELSMIFDVNKGNYALTNYHYGMRGAAPRSRFPERTFAPDAMSGAGVR